MKHASPDDQEKRPRRIGVLGGTFDPIHIAHLAIAEEARTQLGLDKVVFVPAGLPPHKMDVHVSPAEHRLAMVELAIAGNPHFEVSRVDIDRFGPCYTVDTIALLREEWGPDVEIYFIMGSDSLADILTWHKPDRLIRLCRIVAVGRPGYRVDMDELERCLPGASQRILFINSPQLDVSSSEIQRRVRAGESIKYQVPEAVERYIYEHGLYRDT
ncbi:MAG: nicotinic acid mononucleotide adenylyltransferase [Chloroflexota bacterium]|nr:MAG: nicotinic acid mononucleotide adenylyltransferase [Chloroflexota bacterium]